MNRTRSLRQRERLLGRSVLSLLAWTVAVGSNPVAAQTAHPLRRLTEQVKLTGIADGVGDSMDFDFFGMAVALEGDVLAIGAPWDDVPGQDRGGSVYVYQRSGASWTFQQKLTADDPGEVRGFGSSVALSGDTLAVGAPGPAYESAVYVFVKTAGIWQLQRRLEGGFEDAFGHSIALLRNTLVVGAPADDHVYTFGAAYVFTRGGTDWSRAQKLDADFSSEPLFAFFGMSVAIARDTILVGAPYAGTVVLFRKPGDAWIEVGRITPSDSTSGDGFGEALAVSGGTLVVGAPRNAPPGGDSVGAAYVFVGSGIDWEEQQKLVDPEPDSTRQLGAAVAVLGDTALVGTQKWFAPRGSALLFERTEATWSLRQRIQASDGAKGDAFGAAVALWGDTVVVGAPGANTAGGARSGAAYVLGPAGAGLGRLRAAE